VRDRPTLFILTVSGILSLYTVPAVRAENAPAAGLPTPFDGPSRPDPRLFGDARRPAAKASPQAVLTNILADSAVYDREGETALFTGNVVVDHNGQHMEAEKVRIDRRSNLLETEGRTYYEQQGLRLSGERLQFHLDSRQGRLEEVQYRLPERDGRGTAAAVEIVSSDRSRYREITYSTCPAGKDDWLLSADRLKIDRASGVGTARNALLKFKGVPLLYSPYLTFPIDDRRKSGFLTPTLGNSDEAGLDILLPYYFNIAPNMDATLTPRLMSKRGLLLGTEFRLLTERQRSRLNLEVLPNDDEYGRNPGATRGALTFSQRSVIDRRWSSELAINAASDDEYLSDFGGNLGISSTRNLEQRGDLRYRGDEWRFLARLQHFQTIDPGIAPENEPYNRMPQLLVRRHHREETNHLNWNLEAEYDYFAHNAKEYGHRLSLLPSLRLPWRTAFGHLIPEARLFHNSYSLNDRQAGLSSSPSLTLPSLSVDGMLVFERDTRWLGTPALQTLEPRLFYLYTPYHDQDSLPDFDAEELDFNYDNLFRSNRFSGRDRIGDANQLTLGLTSRTLDADSSRELFRLSVGQIFYFRDRTIQLAGEQEETRSSSIIIEAAGRLNRHWQIRAALQWDPHTENHRTEKSSVLLHYQTPDDRIINLGYRFRRDELEDADLSFRWPFSRWLQGVGQVNYSLRHRRTMESFGGIEYGRCCWVLRAIARHYVNEPNGKSDTAFMLQLQLNGLGSVGERVDRYLERGIYGYTIE